MIPDLRQVEDVRVPGDIAAESESTLRSSNSCEAQILWAGKIARPNSFQVTKLVRPIQQADEDRIYVHADEINRIHDELLDARLHVIAQLHTHPGEAYHSYIDNEYPIVTQVGSLSIVVPDFAKAPLDGLGHCAVYRLEASCWNGPLAPKDVRHLIRLETDAP